MSKEAMKLALEALEPVSTFGRVGSRDVDTAKAQEAIAALREALAEQPAQQEQQPVWRTGGGIPRFKQPAQQEPVAAQSVMTVRIWRDKNSDQNAEFKNWHKLPDGEHILYTSPPAQRTWVGLTQEEFRDFASTFEYGTGGLIRAIEAKLKEKNT